MAKAISSKPTDKKVKTKVTWLEPKDGKFKDASSEAGNVIILSGKMHGLDKAMKSKVPKQLHRTLYDVTHGRNKLKLQIGKTKLQLFDPKDSCKVRASRAPSPLPPCRAVLCHSPRA